MDDWSHLRSGCFVACKCSSCKGCKGIIPQKQNSILADATSFSTNIVLKPVTTDLSLSRINILIQIIEVYTSTYVRIVLLGRSYQKSKMDLTLAIKESELETEEMQFLLFLLSEQERVKKEYATIL